MKIREAFRMPAVLGISIFLMLAGTAGSLFSKSLSLLSYAGLILAVAFSALPLIAEQNLNIQEPEGFKRSQFYSISFNCIMLLAIAAYIIYKSFSLFFEPRGINLLLTCWMTFSIFVGLLPCVLLLYFEKEKSNRLKYLFLKYVFCLLLSPLIILASVIYYLKDLYFLDPAVSAATAVLITAQSVLLIKQALLSLMK